MGIPLMNRTRLIFLLVMVLVVLVLLVIAVLAVIRWQSGRAAAPAVAVPMLDSTQDRSLPAQPVAVPPPVVRTQIDAAHAVKPVAPVADGGTSGTNDQDQSTKPSTKTTAQTPIQPTKSDPMNPDLAQRRAAISRLAAAQDLESARELMRFGQETGLHNSAAVEALASFPQAEVTGYLKTRLADPDARVVAAAAKALTGRDGGVPDLAATVKANRRRPDGFENLILPVCVEALGKSGNPDAAPPLIAELQETVATTLDLEYGSQVVAALGNLGSPSAIAALTAYRLRLAAMAERAKADPGVSVHLQKKIAEVDAVLSRLGKPSP